MFKKIIISAIFLLTILIPTSSFAQSCPFQETNCEHPGNCGRYVDSNNDQLCDNSQIKPQEKSETTTKIAATGISKPVDIKTKNQTRQAYHLLPIALILILAYAISHTLTKKQKISLPTHRKFWNLLLLISFLTSALLGVWLVIKINFGLALNLPFNPIFWHVEIGIAMTMISIFHIIWHWGYFKTYLKK